jgi:hypothetical protein
MRGKKRSYLLIGDDFAVSEVMGTLILITMAIVMFSALSLVILNPWANIYDESPPFITLVGSVQGDNITIDHRGGISLDSLTNITLTINGVPVKFDAISHFNDRNKDGQWSIGERVIYNSVNSIAGLQIKCIIVDKKTNTVIMDKILQGP